MDVQNLKAHLYLHAVLPNLEDVVRYDIEAVDISKEWNKCIQFTVRRGPSAHVEFFDGKCRVRPGRHAKPHLKLFFMSPRHLNKMFAGRSHPIPIKGLTKISFLTKEFKGLSEKLEHYLKPTGRLLDQPRFLDMHVRLSLNTAARALKILSVEDKVAKRITPHIRDGTVLIKVLPYGPAVQIMIHNGVIDMAEGEGTNPMAFLLLKNMRIAGRFLNGRLDLFQALTVGDIRIGGQMPMLDAISLILDRIPLYLTL
jgi:hypothetical protein